MLSGNQIKNLACGPDCLPALVKVLAVDRNLVESVTELRYLSASTELKSLSIQGNPLISRASNAGVIDLAPFTKFLVPSLKNLDGVGVSEKDRTVSKTLFSDGRGGINEAQLEILDHEQPLLQYLSHALPSVQPHQWEGPVPVPAQAPAQYVFPPSVEARKKRSTSRNGKSERAKSRSQRPGMQKEDTNDDKVEKLEMQVREMKKMMKMMAKSQRRFDVSGSEDESMLSEAHSKIDETAFNELTTQRVHHDAATVIQASWRGRKTRRDVAKTITENRLTDAVTTLQNQMAHMMQENVVLRKALGEESRRRQMQEEALRSLWGEVQHLQSWAEQISDGQDASFDMSQVHSFREGSPELQAVFSKSPNQFDTSMKSSRRTSTNSKHGISKAGDSLSSVTYF